MYAWTVTDEDSVFIYSADKKIHWILSVTYNAHNNHLLHPKISRRDKVFLDQ